VKKKEIQTFRVQGMEGNEGAVKGGGQEGLSGSEGRSRAVCWRLGGIAGCFGRGKVSKEERVILRGRRFKGWRVMRGKKNGHQSFSIHTASHSKQDKLNSKCAVRASLGL